MFFFDLRLNKRLSKQPWGWWLETPSWSLWRQCNGITLVTGIPPYKDGCRPWSTSILYESNVFPCQIGVTVAGYTSLMTVLGMDKMQQMFYVRWQHNQFGYAVMSIWMVSVRSLTYVSILCIFALSDVVYLCILIRVMAEVYFCVRISNCFKRNLSVSN